MVESVEVSFFLVVFAEGLFELSDGIDMPATDDDRFFLANFVHEFVNELEFFESGPGFVLFAPTGSGPKPDGEGFGEVFDGMGLGVPHVEVEDEFFAERSGFVIAAVGLGHPTEDFPVASHASQAIGIVEGVSGFVAEDAHTLGFGGTFGFQHHAAFEADQSGMGEIEGDGDSGDAVGSVPSVGEPEVGPELKPARFEFLVEFSDTIFEDGSFDLHSEIADPQIQKLLIGQSIQIEFTV